MRGAPLMVIEGYASVFGKVDGGGDIVMPGAFRRCLARRQPADIKMLFQHDPAQPVGVWTDIHEDAHGLKVRGTLAAGVHRAEEVSRLVALGALDGLSIGFKAVGAHRHRKTGLRIISAIDLWEISIVTFPQLTEARIKPPRSPALGCAPPGRAGSAIRAAAQVFHR